MAVMLLTIGITLGFQREIRTKVIGASGHLRITSLNQTDPKETPRIPIDQSFYPWLDTVPGVAHIQVHATYPGIIETAEEIQGVVVKGIGSDYDTTFLHDHLVAGTLLSSLAEGLPNEVLLSRYLCDRLHVDLQDTITIYLVKGHEDIRPRRFMVRGIFRTGIEQVDQQQVLVHIGHIQRFAQWGLKAELLLDEAGPGQLTVEGLAFGGQGLYHYEWPGTRLSGKGPHSLDLRAPYDTTFSLVVSDAGHTIPDTAWIRLSSSSLNASSSPLTLDQLTITRGGSGGSHRYYCGGFEVFLDRYEDIETMDARIYEEYLDLGLRSISVKDAYPELFAWLELLDTNVVVVIVLMVIVAIINMTSGLLILILERTRMIGVLKAMGASDGMIRRVFLWDAAVILGTGIILGDLLGLGLALVQQRTGWVKLSLETYYVEAVPVALEWWPILLLNVGTLVICLVALVLPSGLVSRISPARSIRFD
ncbi:MAG: ABC transporter permease [Flavobacteriales bacterium]|nr:ABC transporter permease [Flavobacteriales bacterium]